MEECYADKKLIVCDKSVGESVGLWSPLHEKRRTEKVMIMFQSKRSLSIAEYQLVCNMQASEDLDCSANSMCKNVFHHGGSLDP